LLLASISIAQEGHSFFFIKTKRSSDNRSARYADHLLVLIRGRVVKKNKAPDFHPGLPFRPHTIF
jgi:hypothetical protein